MLSTERKKPILPLQGVRALAFLGIFLNHSLSGAAGLGAAGVSVFLMMSGFLMACSYLRKPDDPPLRPAERLRFAWKKIRPLYGLHLLMLAAFLCLDLLVSRGTVRDTPGFLGRAALNVLLLQAWVPCSAWYFSLNAVSWYLSAAFFTYFFFPLPLRLLKRGPSVRTLLLWIAALLAAVCGISVLAQLLGDPKDSAWFSRHWITYVFPLARAVDFSIGALAGCLFLRLSERRKTQTGRQSGSLRALCLATAAELTAAALTAFAITVFYRVPQAFRYTAIFTLPSFLLVFTLAQDRGLLSRLLSLRPFRIVGDLSGYAFLIHLLAIRVCTAVIAKLWPSAPKAAAVLLPLAATLIASELFRRLSVLRRTPIARDR